MCFKGRSTDSQRTGNVWPLGCIYWKKTLFEGQTPSEQLWKYPSGSKSGRTDKQSFELRNEGYRVKDLNKLHMPVEHQRRKPRYTRVRQRIKTFQWSEWRGIRRKKVQTVMRTASKLAIQWVSGAGLNKAVVWGTEIFSNICTKKGKSMN